MSELSSIAESFQHNLASKPTGAHPSHQPPNTVGVFQDGRLTQQPLSPLTEPIFWNIPEQKSGILQIISGNAQSFNLAIRTAETCTQLPLKTVRLLLPDALRNKVPPVPTISFSSSTSSGSFAKDTLLTDAISSANLTLLAGDLSKNSATAIALTQAIIPATTPIILARDSTDLLTSEMASLAEKPNLTLFATLAQLQKVFRAIYYPKMLLLSMPLIPVLDTLHKFTLSYPCTILTFHQGQLIFARAGQVLTLPLETTPYSVLTLWTGTFACYLAAFQLWNPSHLLESALAAVLWQKSSPSP